MSKNLRIVFMGTPDFAVGVLKTMVEDGKNIVGVITAPDRPAGRGRKLMASAVKEYALEQHIEVLQPTNLKDENFLQELRALKATLQVVVAFRMLPQVVWEIPEFGTFNLHASLLPEYRGAAPINWAIINGETKTGVTTFFIDEKIDTGAIIAKEEVDLTDDETAQSLHDKLMTVGSQLVLKTIDLIHSGQVEAIPQSKKSNFKGAPKLTTENTRIDWSRPGIEIDRLIRGLSPYPSAWSLLINEGEELKVKIYASKFEKEEHSMLVGSILETKKELKIVTSDGFLEIKEMQLPGKRRMDIISLLNGFSFSEESKMR